MARHITGIGVVLVAIAAAAPAAAQNIDSDARCMLASNYFVRQETVPARKQLAFASQLFYLGRLDARISTKQLADTLQAQAKLMTKDSISATMNDCVKRLQQKDMALKALTPTLPSAPPKAAAKSK